MRRSQSARRDRTRFGRPAPPRRRRAEAIVLRPQPNSRPPGSTTRRPGVARARPWAILRSHQLDPADSIVLFSHSGVNAVILDIALGAKEKGLTVIAVTSLPHSSASPARHSSGKRLFEVADVAIAIAHAIVAATAEKLVRRGIEPLVMVNPNTAGKEAANAANDRNYEELWRRLKAR